LGGLSDLRGCDPKIQSRLKLGVGLHGSIDTGEVIAGKLPPAKVAAVKSWCEDHREALFEDWRRARLRLHPTGRYDSS
jgi:Domain of unknown function (DUF4160)